MTRSLRRTVLVAAVAILLVQALATGLMLERGRQEAIAQANQTVDRIARAVEANINRHFTQVESLLFGLPVILGPARDGRFDPARASEVLQELNNQNLIYRDLLLLDSSGQAVATALSVYRRRRLPVPTGPSFNESGLHDGGLRIGGPIRNPASREWGLFFANPVSVAGLPNATAMAEIPLAHLSTLLASGGEAPGLRITLMRNDGMLLAALPHEEAQIATKPDATTGPPVLALTRPTLYGNLTIRVTMTRDAALAAWSADRWPAILFSAAFGMLIVTLAGLLSIMLRQRERAESDRDRWRSTLASALDSMTDGFVLFGPDDRLVICNQRFREMYALSAPFIREGAYFRDIMREGALRGQFPQLTGDIEAAIDEMVRWRRSKGPPLESLLPDGRWILITERMTPDGGTIGIRTDITELKRANEELARARDAAHAEDEAKGMFLARMSHELRTPLNSMLGFAQALMQDNNLGHTQRDQLRLLHDAGGHLRELVNRLLDLTKIEAGQLDLDARPVTLRPLFEACVGLMAPDVDRKRLRLTLDISPAMPEVVEADAMRLRQMLLNLLSNAVKFTPTGGRVDLRVRTLGRNQVGLRIEVQDSGPGVPPDKRHLLFRDFTQISPHAESEGLGTGLGLAITARLAGAMGGSIGCDSEPGAGALFWLELPLRTLSARPEPVAPIVPSVPLPAGLRVLVADDLAPNRLVIQALLAPAGHHVDFVNSGSGAVSTVERESYDIVLMDVHMPGMDGLEATRRIRALPAPKGATPILGVTASTLPEEVSACYEAGMDGHLAKPIDRDALFAAMAELMAGHSWRAALPAMVLPPDEPPLVNRITLRRALAELGPMASHAMHDMVDEIIQGCDVLAEPHIARDVTRMRQAAHMVMEPARSLGAERLTAGIDRLQRAIRAGQDVTPYLQAVPRIVAETVPLLESVSVGA
ncbi:ATP-binding protein [Sediminicoccus sp. KRV36]|uniref:ATP-binding protein n=1 Tax=Sediminicoccus sp. KRV36 TaxID=3133721 RepID=UPI00200D3AA3|nr:ATP-binding protein [Sediminicoccus rosea]UPY35653.1 PAS-domain containing protein [Sediminicoccus rosea]